MSLSNDELTKRLLALEAADLRGYELMLAHHAGGLPASKTAEKLIEDCRREIARLSVLLPPRLSGGEGVYRGDGVVDTATDDEQRTKNDLQAVVSEAQLEWSRERQSHLSQSRTSDQHISEAVLRAVEDLKIHQVRAVATTRNGAMVFFSPAEALRLRKLVIYAYKTLCAMEGTKPGSVWKPYDHAHDLLSQLSNILTGIQQRVKQSEETLAAGAKLIAERDAEKNAREAAIRALSDLRQDYTNTGRELGAKERALINAKAALASAGWHQQASGAWQPPAGAQLIQYDVLHDESDDEHTPDWRVDWRIWTTSEEEALRMGRLLTAPKCPREVQVRPTAS